MEGFIDVMNVLDSVHLTELPPMTTLLVWTMNSFYRVVVTDGADVYVQTVIRPDLVRAIPSARLQDILDYHSSCEDAGRTAAKAGVRTLVLTHPVPPPAPGSEAEWVEQAAAHFDGEIVLAHDLMQITA